MNGKLLLLVSLCGFVSADTLVKPEKQVVNEYEDVVIDCISQDMGKVRWGRPRGLPLPKNAKQHGIRLYIKNTTLSNAGYYVCSSKNSRRTAMAFVRVNRRPVSTQQTPVNNFQSATYGLQYTTAPTTMNPFSSNALTFSTPYPCAYGVCNGTCCESTSINSFFDCANGQKINMSLVCNRVNDCEDGSDESKCAPWPPKITVLPKSKMEVYCGDEDETKSGTLIFECESVGHPTPVIRWKKYDGHVPTKCQQYSKGGHGILTCFNFQQADQGSYSCVAENSVELAESQPTSIAKCSNTINCRGFQVVNEEDIEHCLECYCSGKSTQCQNLKSNPTEIKIPFPETQTEIFAKDNGEILFVPSKTELSPSFTTRQFAREIIYCSLSETELQDTSLLKSFGRNIIIPRYKGKTDFLEKAPDVIIRGNNLTLMYTANLLPPLKTNITNLPVRFWPGNWLHLNKRAASRRDLMKVLSNIESIFLRCEFEQRKVLESNRNKTIIIESSTISDFSNSVSYVEKCSCPIGYDGLSCETCATGYEKQTQSSGFICEKIYVPPVPCEEGYIGEDCKDCDTDKGYRRKGDECVKPKCHPDGSTSIFPGVFNKCNCKEGVTGDYCDQCKSDSFYLHKEGCLKCWCSGVSTKCKATELVKSVISNTPRGGYNSSDGSNFWLLPSEFSGNRLTSYGGHLNYTMRFKPGIPKQTNSLGVEFLSRGDVTLVYTHTTTDDTTKEDKKSWTVPLIEKNWRKLDKSSVSRGEFLAVLSRIKAIYIESPYHLSSGEATLISIRMSTAIPVEELGVERTEVPVENCTCPPGYTGLSCESCSRGYYRKRNGTINQCLKCNCPYCDPEFGCVDCPELQYRDNPVDEKIPVCKPCPCNGNGVSCVKDDLNQIFCQCKPGYRGMHCENAIPEDKNDLAISISPRRIKGKKVGTTIRVNCTLVSSEEMTFTAEKRFQKNYYNNSKIVSNYGSKLTELFDVPLEDGLEAIECFAYDSEQRIAGHVVAAIIDLITVIEPVKITDCFSDRIDVKEAESRDIICNATGSPTPVISWYKKEKDVPTVKVDTSDGVHSIESASLKDNGTIYTCIAENSEGYKDTCTKVLIVKRKCEVINIIPKQVTVTEGNDFSLQCKTTAKSPVTWSALETYFNKEKEISSPRGRVDGSNLRFTNSSVLDSGTYICTAAGENGKINKTVLVVVEEKRVPPMVTIQEYDMIVKEGETVNVNCIVTGKPMPTVNWMKVNDTLAYNAYSSGKTLTITKATEKNSGIYGCVARSVAGNDSSFISIEVQKLTVPPKINVSETVISAHVGEEPSLSCLGIGYPRPKLSWATSINFTGIARQEDNMVLIEPNESVKEEATFKVTKDMNGVRITCIGENEAGRDEASTVIKVLQSTRGINETIEFVPIGSFFELQCEFPENLTWHKKGGLVGDECPIPNGLLIPSVQIQHNGTYICKSSDSEKIINLIVVGFVPRFSKAAKTYLVLPVQLKSPNYNRIELTFNATKKNGILLQEQNDRLEIYIVERKIHFGVNSRTGGSVNAVMNKPIQLGVWYTLVVFVDRSFVDITVYDDNSAIHERKTEQSNNFTGFLGFTEENFFLGGPSPAMHLGKVVKKHHSHFEGCISRLLIDRHEFDIVKEGTHSNNVTLCNRCLETYNPCSGRGKCLDAPTQYGFVCVCPKDQDDTCPASCAGKVCETTLDLCSTLKPCGGGYPHTCTNNMYHLQCQCAYGYAGITCEKVQQHSFCTRGNGFVKLPSSLLRRRLGMREFIRMSFTLQKSTGQLLWQGNHANYLSIAVRDGILHYVYLNQHSKLEVRVGSELSLDKKHLITVSRINNTVTLELTRASQNKGTAEVYRNSTSKAHTNRVRGDIYLGNVPNDTHHIGRHVGLSGCIHYISFVEGARVNLPGTEVEKFNTYIGQTYDTSYDSDESVEENSDSSESRDSNVDGQQYVVDPYEPDNSALSYKYKSFP